jgi:hypothetical protein
MNAIKFTTKSGKKIELQRQQDESQMDILDFYR